MVKINKIQSIDLQEWDALVCKTYGKPYSLQQQDGCKERGVEYIEVPTEYPYDFENDSVPEEINGHKMGVSFVAWLSRDPTTPVAGRTDWGISLWWDRNFYPSTDMLVNDLHAKGLLPAGEYQIDIDW